MFKIYYLSMSLFLKQRNIYIYLVLLFHPSILPSGFWRPQLFPQNLGIGKFTLQNWASMSFRLCLSFPAFSVPLSVCQCPSSEKGGWVWSLKVRSRCGKWSAAGLNRKWAGKSRGRGTRVKEHAQSSFHQKYMRREGNGHAQLLGPEVFFSRRLASCSGRGAGAARRGVSVGVRSQVRTGHWLFHWEQ